MRLTTWMAALVLALSAGVAVAADKPSETWDGLVEVKAKRLDAAFLAPGADFRPYTKLMVDPTQAEVFHEAFGKAGYTIVDKPGPDVLRVTPGVVNLYVNAPDVMSAGRSTSYTANAGEATMLLELRDSQSNALLGRVLDRRETRDSMGMQTANRVTNTADFRLLFKSWASGCVKGLETLKSVSPLPATLTSGQKVD
jgi:hypothetical protein